MSDDQPIEMPAVLVVPDGMRAGTYANYMTIWNNGPHDFTLDFGVIGTPEQGPNGPLVPVDLVARVKVAPSVVFEIAKAIAQNVDTYEQRFGPITPRPPDASPTYPPPPEET